MADPQLPDITAELAALPYPNSVKAELFDAFYAEKNGKDEHVNAILDRLDVPRELKNSLLDRRQKIVYPEVFQQTSTPPVADKPQGTGVLERAAKNAPKSGANLIKGALSEATLLGPMQRGAAAVKSVAGKAAEGYKAGGIGGAADAGLEEGVNQAISPVVGAVSKIGHSLTSPLESFAEDPFGTVLDIVSVAIPIAKNARGIGSAVEGGVQALKGTKPGTTAPPSSPGILDRIGGVVKAVKEGFSGKPTEAPPQATQPQQNMNGPAAESAMVFESGQKPVSREGLQKQQDLKSKIEAKRIAPPPKIETSLVKSEQPKTQARFVADQSGNMADTTKPPVYTPVESEIVEPQNPRFYAGPGGTVDASNPPKPPVKPTKAIDQPPTKGLLSHPEEHLSTSRPPSTPTVDKPVPVDKPVVTETSTVQQPVQSAVPTTPKTTTPPKSVKSKFQTQPAPVKIEQPSETVSAVAPKVEPVKSPTPSKLETSQVPKKGEPVTSTQKTATRESESLKRRIGDKAKKIEPGKDGKISYKNSRGELKSTPVSDSIDLYEMNGETYALGTDPNHSNYGKLTSLDGKRTVMDVYADESSTPKVEAPKAEIPKTPAPPKKKEPEVAPVKKSFATELSKEQLDESPMKRHIRSLREKHGSSYKLTPDDWKEARTLANEEESSALSGKEAKVEAPVVTVKKLMGKLEHTVKVEGSGSNSRKISVDYRDPKSGRGSTSMDLVKEGDNVYLIDSKTRKRISSYPKMSLEDALAIVTK